MNVTIIGLGLIGGSIAKDLKRTGFATGIVGVDNLPEHREKAVELGIADRCAELESAVQHTDLVIIAIPVDKIKVVLPRVLDLIPENTTVTDVGSTKREIVSMVDDHPRRGNYVPSHPMSGTENSGPVAAIEHLFENKICILCDQEKSRPQHVALIEKMYQSIGMSTAYMSSDEQDHNTAFVSHLPHVTAFALANAVLAKEDRSIIFDLASGGFRSTVRLAKSSPEMWGPIFHQNRDYMVDAIEEYQKHLEAFKKSIQKEDDSEMKQLIKQANGIRSVLDGGNQSMTKKEKTIIQLFTPKN
jgi:prephenate dehydrogenase